MKEVLNSSAMVAFPEDDEDTRLSIEDDLDDVWEVLGNPSFTYLGLEGREQEHSRQLNETRRAGREGSLTVGSVMVVVSPMEYILGNKWSSSGECCTGVNPDEEE